MFLTQKQLEQLTGYVQPAAQIRWLQRNRVTHYVRADGRPVVPRSAVGKERVEVTGSGSTAKIGPNLDAVRLRH